MPRVSVFSVLVLLCTFGAISYAVQPATRETVRFVSSHQYEGYSMRVVMESHTAVYVLKCIYKTAGCIIPVPDQPYYLITESTPLGKYDSAWLKNWYAECDKAPTIGIVPVSDWPDEKDFMKAYNAVGAYCLESMTVRK
jgi:hypothetical protein